MAVPPIQFAVFGPGSGSSFPAQFPNNVVAGNLIVVGFWCNTSLTLGASTATDDASTPNAYTRDVEDTTTTGGTDNTYAAIYSTTIVNGGGTKLTVTVTIGGRGGTTGRLFIAEYPRPDTTRVDDAASAITAGGSIPTVNVTTTLSNGLIFSIASWGGFTSPVGTVDTGYTEEDNQNPASWGGLMQDRDAAVATSYSATASITGGPGQVVVLAVAYRMAAPATYIDTISLAASNLLVALPGNTVSLSTDFGATSSDTNDGSGGFNPLIALQALESLLQSVLWSTTPQSSIATLAGVTTDQSLVMQILSTMAAAAGIQDQAVATWAVDSTWAGIVNLIDAPAISGSDSIPLAVAHLLALVISQNVAGLIAPGTGVAIGNDPTLSMSASANLQQMYLMLTDAGRAFVNIVEFGIVNGLTSDVGKAVVDSVQLSNGVTVLTDVAYQGLLQLVAGLLANNAAQVETNIDAQVAMMTTTLVVGGASTSTLAVMAAVIGSAIRSVPGCGSRGTISLANVLVFLSQIPESVIPGLARVIATMVNSGVLSPVGPTAKVTAKLSGEATVDDI